MISRFSKNAFNFRDNACNSQKSVTEEFLTTIKFKYEKHTNKFLKMFIIILYNIPDGINFDLVGEGREEREIERELWGKKSL